MNIPNHFKSEFVRAAMMLLLTVMVFPTEAWAAEGYCGKSNENEGKNVTWKVTDEDNDNTNETLTISGTGAMADFEMNDVPWIVQNINTVVIEGNVTSIGSYAFAGCKIESIIIPSSVTSLGEGCFYSCHALTGITIPASVTSISEGAFSYCESLGTISVALGNTTYDSRDNCNAIIETGSNTLIAGCENTVIPTTVEHIGSNAFYNSSNLTSITIPSSVTSIGLAAFCGCTLLNTVYVMPTKAPSLGSKAFDNVSSTCKIYVNGADYKSGNWSSINKTFISTVTATGVTATTTETPVINYDNKDYYAQGTEFTLSYSGTLTTGYITVYTAKNSSGEDVTSAVINGSTLTIPDYDVSITATTTDVWGVSAPTNADGSETKPYIITTTEGLDLLAMMVNGTDGFSTHSFNGKYFKLGNDIDCDGKTDFEPIGNGSKQFEGTFDGNNKTISNLSMTNVISQDVGLFGYNNGTIKNLTLSNCTISGGSSSSPSYIGALAGQNAGSISGCTVINCTVSCNENSSNPYVGGIAGILHGSITNCVVENTSVNAVTSDVSASVPTAYAGGIAGSRSNNTISGCTVKGTTTVTADYSNCSTDVFAGAIVGILQGQGTFTDNTYESTVTTKAKKQGDSDYTTKSGQTQRGIGDGDDVIGQVELAGTKKVTVEIISFAGSNWSCNAVEGTYYTYTSTSTNYIYYVLPGCDFTYSMKPENGRKPAFALSDNTIKVTAVEKTEEGAYDHTEFTFTMPNADLEVTRSFPIDLATISADNFSIDNANYTGEAIVPTKVKARGVTPGAPASYIKELVKDEDFTIKGYKLNGESVDSPVEIGIYTVTIEGIGEYIGTQDVSYEIIKAYALKINGTQLNAKNIDDFYGNGTVKFTPATETEPTNTLTLNGASVTGTIESGLGNLTIKLIGSNTIQGNGSSLIISLNGGTLTFDSDGTTISLLEFKDASGNVFPNDPISGFAEVKYGWVEYVESEVSKKVCSWDIEILKNGTSYRIYDGNKDHILGEGDESVKYSHDATNGHVITLNNAEVNCIWTDIHADITIALNGTNRVIDTGGTYAIYSNNGTINIVKAEGATSAELTATCGNGYVPIEYGSITLGEGLYWKPFYADDNATVKSTVITDDPEFIIIENYVMTDDRSIETAITYDSTEKILTFNSYAGALTSQIKTGVQGLTIKLKGTSTVAAGSLDYPFKAMTNTASILFDGENGSETGSLVMDTNSDSAPFEGFAEGAITYNKVVYSRDDGNNNIHTIQAPTAPAMSLDNEKVKLTKDYDDGTIYYSIAYADDTPSETGVKYTEPFAITHPGVVTAWVEANNATTSTVTGKHFAYQDAPYTMAINGIKTPTLLPTIAEGDVISLQRYASEDEDIASFIDGLITAKKPGTVTLSAILMPGDNTPFKVLNPVSDPNDPNKHTVSFIVYVGEPLSNYFEGSNEFGTFYNEDSEIYAVPQGMKAYVVTGVSGSKLVTVETTVLPPNTVVLLEKGSAISFTKVPSEGAAPGGNLLKHATADISVTTESSLYVLYNDMYVKATAGSQIPSGKNYLDLSPTTNAGTRGFYNIIGEDETTGIVSMDNGKLIMDNEADAQWHDLQGRRIEKPTKTGLYILNGKKTVINNK